MSARDMVESKMVQKNLIFKCGVIVILLAILAGILFLVLEPKSACNNEESILDMQTDNGAHSGITLDYQQSLQRLIVLVHPGPRNALVRLSGVDLDAGALLADARLQLQGDGRALLSEYFELLNGSSVTWFTTSDPWIYESSESFVEGVNGNLSIPVLVPPVFGGGVEDLYIRMIPLLEILRERIPECLVELAAAEVPEAPEEVVTFWAYLIGEGVDNLNASTLSSMNLTFGSGCLSEKEPVITDDILLNVTRASADLLAPMLSSVMIEVLSLGNSAESSDESAGPLRVYGMSEWHVQLMLMCVREKEWLGRPGHHVVLELYESRVNIIYGEQSRSMSTLEFVRSIALCGALIAGDQ